jgi:hypothetical protein
MKRGQTRGRGQDLFLFFKLRKNLFKLLEASR